MLNVDLLRVVFRLIRLAEGCKESFSIGTINTEYNGLAGEWEILGGENQKILLLISSLVSTGLSFLNSFIFSSMISLGYSENELFDRILLLLGLNYSSRCEFLISLYSCSSS